MTTADNKKKEKDQQQAEQRLPQKKIKLPAALSFALYRSFSRPA
jgi:hypothetical protein